MESDHAAPAIARGADGRDVGASARVHEWLASAKQLFSVRHPIAGIPVIACDPYTAARALPVLVPSEGKTGKHVHFVNAYTVALASEDENLRNVLSTGALNFPDGKPLQWVSALAGHSPRIYQVRGPAYFEQAISTGREAGLKHFLLGSTPEVLEKLKKNLVARYPGALIVGAESPPFRKLSDAEYKEQDARIVASGANVVWVGLGTPKQDFEARRISESLPVVALAVGAAFDFSAGTLEEAPDWVRAIGFEWMFRLIKEPRRLWRRYLIGNTRFIRATAADALGQRRNRS